jgi:hypothetical protein
VGRPSIVGFGYAAYPDPGLDVGSALTQTKWLDLILMRKHKISFILNIFCNPHHQHTANQNYIHDLEMLSLGSAQHLSKMQLLLGWVFVSRSNGATDMRQVLVSDRIVFILSLIPVSVFILLVRKSIVSYLDLQMKKKKCFLFNTAQYLVYQINFWWDQSSERMQNTFLLSKDNMCVLSQESETTQIRYFWVFKFWDNTQYWVIHVLSCLCCTVAPTVLA